MRYMLNRQASERCGSLWAAHPCKKRKDGAPGRQSPSQGRWISPDPLGRGAVKLTNPQTWNRYAYVTNNPLRLIDPVGEDEIETCDVSSPDCFDPGAAGDADDGDDDNSGNNDGCQYDACVTADAPPDVPTQDSTMTCTTLPAVGPPGVSIAANVQTARSMQAVNNATALAPGQGFVETQVWMLMQFSTGGSEDYKQQGQGYVDFGNFNFGAVCGGLGYSLTYCQSAAGTALIGRSQAQNYLAAVGNAANAGTGVVNPGVTYNGQGVPFVSAPYGDQPEDSEVIAQGYQYDAQGCDQ